MLVKPEPINKKHDEITFEAHSVAKAFETLLAYYKGNDTLSDSEEANFADTPVRAAKAFCDLVSPKSRIIEEVKDVLSTGFPMEPTEEDSEVIVQGPISVQSLCPHHMLAVSYEVFIAYKPMKGGTVLGLSKYARLAKALGRRPVLQEQLGRDIADCLHYVNVRGTSMPDGSVRKGKDLEGNPWPQIESEGSAVQLLGHHSCMACRGVRENAITLTTTIRGCFHEPSLKEEFYQAVSSIRQAK